MLDGGAKQPAVQMTLEAKGFDGLRLLKDYAGLDRFEGEATGEDGEVAKQCLLVIRQ